MATAGRVPLQNFCNGTPSEKDQLKIQLEIFMEKPLVEGDTWFLVENKWFKKVKAFLGMMEKSPWYNGSYPGVLNNRPLWNEDGSDIREQMIEEGPLLAMEGDYVLLPNEVWDMLVLNNFGLLVNMETGDTAVRRKVIKHGMFVKQLKVEVYFMELQLAENSNLEVTMKQKFSKSSKVGQIVGVMSHLFGIPTTEEVRLWNKYTSNTYEQLARMDMTTQDAGLFSGQLLIIERRQGDGTWARQARPDVTRHGRDGIVRAPEIVDAISRVEEQRGEEDENTREETKVEDMIRSMRQELRLDLSSKVKTVADFLQTSFT